MSSIGVPELLIFGILGFPLLGVLLFWVTFGRRAKRFGYPNTRAYLRAAPRSDDDTLMDTLTTSLRTLPNPALPRDLTADVLARVEAVEQQRPAPVSAALSPLMLAVPGSVLAVAAIAASVTSGDLPLFHVAPLSVGGLDMPPNDVGGLSLLVGLALYALGLFGTVGQRRMPYSSTSP